MQAVAKLCHRYAEREDAVERGEDAAWWSQLAATGYFNHLWD